MFAPLDADFLGLSLALRTHDQFPGISLVPPPSLLVNLETWKLRTSGGKKLKELSEKMPFLSISVHFSIGATIRISRGIQCLRYAGFFKDNLIAFSLLHYVSWH